MPAKKAPKMVMTPEQCRHWSNGKKFMGKVGVTERGDAGVHVQEVIKVMPEYSAAVLITKNPGLLLPHLDEFDAMHPYGNNQSYIIHCGITGYGGSSLEPNVPKPAEAIKDYYKLVSRLGGERVVLRIDPIIPTDKGMEVAYDILAKARGRVRLSFFDAYNHVLARMNGSMRDKISRVYNGDFHAPLALRLAAYGRMYETCPVQCKSLEVCGEPGMVCTGCISLRDMRAMGHEGDFERRIGGKQRPTCRCLMSKQDMLTHKGQCKHGCLYCYWK